MSWLSCIISFHFHPHSKCWRCQWVWRGDNSGSMSHPISLMVVHVCANQKHRLPLGQLLRMPLPPLSKGTAAAWDICAESDLEKDSAPRKNLSPTPEARRDGNTGNTGQCKHFDKVAFHTNWHLFPLKMDEDYPGELFLDNTWYWLDPCWKWFGGPT